jgi:hypothetical protein
MRHVFNGFFEVQWIRPEDKMPLDDFFESYPGNRGKWGIITDVMVLINDEEDPNDDPTIVQLQYLVDNDGTGHWNFLGGESYHECHAANIKFWAEIPDYEKSTVEDYNAD